MNIRAYTVRAHGEPQARVYIGLLRDRMRQAANSPEAAGRARDDVKPGYFVIRAGKRHIYYRIRETHIDIIDVLHQRMDPANYV